MLLRARDRFLEERMRDGMRVGFAIYWFGAFVYFIGFTFA